jgi:hypothetical protein
VLPQAEFFGVTITEPMTTATDYMIMVAAFWFATKLLVPASRRSQLSQCSWGVAFIFLGLSALFGGTNHGFVRYMQQEGLDLLWSGTLYCIGLAMFFVLVGTVSGSVANRTWRAFFYAYSVVVCSAYAWWIFDHDDFVYAVLINVSTFIIISGLQLSALKRYRAESAKWILSGVIVSFLGAAIQRSGFALHVHFNHNDLYHVVQIVGLYLFYRGASVMHDIIPADSSASRVPV